MGMRKLLLIALCIALNSCIEVDDANQQIDKSILLQGLVVAGDAETSIKIERLDLLGNINPAIGISLNLEGPLGTIQFVESSPGIYQNSESLIFPSADYILRGNDLNNEFMAEARTPALFELTSAVASNISVDPNQEFEQLINLDWTESGNSEYVLVLTLLEADSVEIPFANGGGNFSTVFANPQPESGTVLLASDFKYYGAHRLEIFAISKEYSSIFNPVLLVNRDDVPYISGNLIGGFGFFAACTKLSIEFTLE